MKRLYQFILVIETLSLTGDITYYICLSPSKFRDFLEPLQKFIFADRERCAAWGASHFCSPPLEIGVRSQKSGARRKEEEGRRKEPEEVFLQI